MCTCFLVAFGSETRQSWNDTISCWRWDAIQEKQAQVRKSKLLRNYSIYSLSMCTTRLHLFTIQETTRKKKKKTWPKKPLCLGEGLWGWNQHPSHCRWAARATWRMTGKLVRLVGDFGWLWGKQRSKFWGVEKGFSSLSPTPEWQTACCGISRMLRLRSGNVWNSMTYSKLISFLDLNAFEGLALMSWSTITPPVFSAVTEMGYHSPMSSLTGSKMAHIHSIEPLNRTFN